jgi:hypothetical protein
MTRSNLANPRQRPGIELAKRSVYLAIASLSLLVVSALLNDASLDFLLHPLKWLASLDQPSAIGMLSNAGEVVAAVLAIAATVVAIVVELAATRYSHEITGIFLREPVNMIVLGLFVLTTVQCVWVGPVLTEPGADALVPPAGFALTLGLVTICLLLLVPYIYYVFTFLTPTSIIDKISRDAYKQVVSVQADNIAERQRQVGQAVDELQDVARSAIQQGDRGIAMSSVDALAGFVSEYLRVRDKLPDSWFVVTKTIAADPDFVALSAETMDEVRAQGIWLERKVLRRFMSLVGESAIQARDVANLVGINTQQIASELLCLRAFNTYLRVTITAGDARTAYFLMNQYRLLGSRMMREGKADTAVQIADYLKLYGQLGHARGNPFLLEAASYDVKTLVEDACEECPEAVDRLLDCLLQLDTEIKAESEYDSLLGVRRSQMQVATLLIQKGDEVRLQRVVDDLRGERLSRLERLREVMETDDNSQYAELMDRGVNFAYLVPERRQYLKVLFEHLQANAPPSYEADPSAV